MYFEDAPQLIVDIVLIASDYWMAVQYHLSKT